jgi:uncharacterized protein DUF1996/carbohydrate binding protein with CBM6 domain
VSNGPRRSRLVLALTAAVAVLAGVPTMIALTQSADAATGDPLPSGAVRASGFSAQKGAQLENTNDAGGGQNVGWLSDGDWLRYDDLDLGPGGATTVAVRLAAAYADRPGQVQIRADAPDGALIAGVAVTPTGGNQSWRTVTARGTAPAGRHPVFLVIRSGQPNDFVNLNWFALGAATPTPSPSSVPSSAPSSVPSSAPASPAADGWIPVDRAKWAAQLAAFNAVVPLKPPAGHNKNAEFNATCTFSHAKPDDPIVFPRMAGASHLHSFVGNSSTDANSTPETLMRLTASTCKPLEDHSAYWVPTLLEHGQPVQPKSVVVYYGSLLADKTRTVPMPAGMRMIAGDAKKQTPTPRGAVNQFYCAGGPQDGKTRSTDQNWPVCDGGTLHYTLRFPDCWDGRNLDSPDHKSHVSFGGGGVCPAAFPVPIPALTFSISYPTSGTADGFKLSSGMASSMHGDAFFAWEDGAMAQRVKDCVVQVAQCNTEGRF